MIVSIINMATPFFNRKRNLRRDLCTNQKKLRDVRENLSNILPSSANTSVIAVLERQGAELLFERELKSVEEEMDESVTSSPTPIPIHSMLLDPGDVEDGPVSDGPVSAGLDSDGPVSDIGLHTPDALIVPRLTPNKHPRLHRVVLPQVKDLLMVSQSSPNR